MPSLSESLAAYVFETRLAAIPAPARAAAKRLLLDTLAVAWAGSDAPGLAQMRAALLPQGGAAQSTLWADASRVPMLDAAFLNGVAAAALDYDALHLEAFVHCDIVCLPALLATAEQVGASGEQFLAALILANEVTCRLGLATRLHSGWFYTSIHGVFGAAAGCAKLRGLGVDAIRDAFGIALSQAGGTQQPMVEKSLTKRIQSAFAARAGAFSAVLAGAGVGAPRDAFEGRFGFYNKYEQGNAALVLAGLGERYVYADTAIKKYPSCACNHAVIEATLELVREHDLQPGDCTAAKAIISPYMARLVGSRYDPERNPQVAAQFSVQYSLASALARRRLGIAEIQARAALEPRVLELAQRVQVVVDEANSGELAPAAVELVTTAHGTLRRNVACLPGSAQRPLTDAELAAKVRECMQLGASPLTEARIARLCARVAQIETIADMSRWLDGI